MTNFDFRPINQRTGEVKDTPLADDLADVLTRMVLTTLLEQHPDVQRVMARYRQSKIPCEAHIYHGPGHQSKTFCESRHYPHTEHRANIMGEMVEWSFPLASLDYDGYTTHERVYCDEGDNCHCLREPGATTLCPGYMHPRNRK
jgi:hypothetical protein